jgi:hypothetical protein
MLSMPATGLWTQVPTSIPPLDYISTYMQDRADKDIALMYVDYMACGLRVISGLRDKGAETSVWSILQAEEVKISLLRLHTACSLVRLLHMITFDQVANLPPPMFAHKTSSHSLAVSNTA